MSLITLVFFFWFPTLTTQNNAVGIGDGGVIAATEAAPTVAGFALGLCGGVVAGERVCEEDKDKRL